MNIKFEISSFSSLYGARCEKDLKDNKHDNLHLGRKYLVNKPLQAAGMSADNVCG